MASFWPSYVVFGKSYKPIRKARNHSKKCTTNFIWMNLQATSNVFNNINSHCGENKYWGRNASYHMTNPVLRRQRHVVPLFWYQPDLHSESGQGFIERPCLKMRKRKPHTKNNNLRFSIAHNIKYFLYLKYLRNKLLYSLFLPLKASPTKLE